MGAMLLIFIAGADLSAETSHTVNLLTNGSFEQVDKSRQPANWRLSKQNRKGHASLKVVKDGADGAQMIAIRHGTDMKWAYATQTVWRTLARGERFTLSVWLRSDKPVRASLMLAAMGAPPKPGEKVLVQQKREWFDLTTTWQQCKVGIKLDRFGSFVRLWSVVQLHTPDVDMYIKDARLIDLTPKPADVSNMKFAVACVRTNKPPVIDGKLDDECWKRAGVTDDFWNTEDNRHEKPTQQTVVYLLHDDAYLYIAFRLAETDIASIKAAVSKRDAGVWGDDCAELFLLPPDSTFPGVALVGPTRYYHMVVNSLGVKQDGIGKQPAADWNANWQASTHIDKDEWTVEIRIAFKQLDSKPTGASVWKVNFNRSEKRLGENSSWARMKIDFHDPARFGHMFFVDEPGDAGLVMAQAVAAQAKTIRRDWLNKLKPTLTAVTSAGDALSPLKRSLTDLQEHINNLSASQVVKQRGEVKRRLDSALAQAHVQINKHAKPGLRIFATRAITNDRVLPTSLVANRLPIKLLALSACRGEYESVSFIATASQDLSGVTVRCSDMTGAQDSIDASNIDIKLVKCWYQANNRQPGTGGDVTTQRGKALMPELLLNDDQLVRVDLKTKQNLLRVIDTKGNTRYEDVSRQNDEMSLDMTIRDAPSLQPINIKAGYVQQFWLTVHVPDDAVSGTYRGNISVISNDATPQQIPIELTVHPFDLAKPMLVYSMFYRSKIGPKGSAATGDWRTPQQYRRELQDLIAHGITSPLVYQSPSDMDLLRQALELRRQAGVSTERFFLCAWGAGPKDIPEPTRKVLTDVRLLIESFGYQQFYNFGKDEPSAQQLLEFAPAYRFLHEQMNIKTYYACNVLLDSTGQLRPHLWDAIKDNTAALTIGGLLNPQFAGYLTDAGMEVYSYANPQCGEEEPLTYRRNYGLALWKAGYSGAMNYAYQHGCGRHPWNDFDPVKHNYRDHMMAYPTIDGVVGTVQWEGFREGVDDVRYLSTLLTTIEQARKQGVAEQQIVEIEKWIAKIDPAGDLVLLRAEMVEKIIELTSLMGQR